MGKKNDNGRTRQCRNGVAGHFHNMCDKRQQQEGRQAAENETPPENHQHNRDPQQQQRKVRIVGGIGTDGCCNTAPSTELERKRPDVTRYDGDQYQRDRGAGLESGG